MQMQEQHGLAHSFEAGWPNDGAGGRSGGQARPGTVRMNNNQIHHPTSTSTSMPTHPPTPTLRPDSSAAAPPFSRPTSKATTGRQSGNSPRSSPPHHGQLHKTPISGIDHPQCLRPTVSQSSRQSARPRAVCAAWQSVQLGPCNTSLHDEDGLQRE